MTAVETSRIKRTLTRMTPIMPRPQPCWTEPCPDLESDRTRRTPWGVSCLAHPRLVRTLPMLKRELSVVQAISFRTYFRLFLLFSVAAAICYLPPYHRIPTALRLSTPRRPQVSRKTSRLASSLTRKIQRQKIPTPAASERSASVMIHWSRGGRNTS